MCSSGPQGAHGAHLTGAWWVYGVSCKERFREGLEQAAPCPVVGRWI